MNRRTTNPRDAMHRLASHLNVALTSEGKQYRLRVRDLYDRGGSAKRVLAWLVEAAQFPTTSGGYGLTREEVREIIRLDNIDEHGLKGHEYSAIKLVTLAVNEGRR